MKMAFTYIDISIKTQIHLINNEYADYAKIYLYNQNWKITCIFSTTLNWLNHKLLPCTEMKLDCDIFQETIETNFRHGYKESVNWVVRSSIGCAFQEFVTFLLHFF